jgi:Na+-driven multidrug efflux pump
MVTYTGQNIGAEKYRRVKDGIKASLAIGILSAAAIGGLILLGGKHVIGFFLNEEGQTALDALAVGTEFLNLMAVTLPVLYILHIARSVLQGFGDTVVPMISGFAECAARILMAVAVSRLIGWPAMIWAEIAAWLAADLVLFKALFSRVKGIDSIMNEQR